MVLGPEMPKPTIFAIDFGTSNSLLTAASPNAVFPPAPLDPEASDPTVLRSALYFQSLREGRFGQSAIHALIENGFRGRLIRSIKRHLPSKSFTATRIGNKNATLEDIIGAFLGAMRERACAHFDVDVRRVVMGRPAKFSLDADEDQLAEDRLRGAAGKAGFEDISFCPEPVAAAYDFADDLDEPKVVLVADLGGGTSDFTVVRMSKHGFAPEDVLAVGGVAVAGDAIDGGLVRSVVAPHFGGRARYRVPFGSNDLDMPRALIELLASPADLTVLDREKVLRELTGIRSGLLDAGDRPRLERFFALVEDGLGFALYEAVEGAKRRLSDADETELVVEEPSLAFSDRATREGLERASERALSAIVSALDKTVEQSGLAPEAIDIVCLTGGTSRMPLAVQALTARLPRAQVRRLKSFHSVALGLARHARSLA